MIRFILNKLYLVLEQRRSLHKSECVGHVTFSLNTSQISFLKLICFISLPYTSLLSILRTIYFHCLQVFWLCMKCIWLALWCGFTYPVEVHGPPVQNGLVTDWATDFRFPARLKCSLLQPVQTGFWAHSVTCAVGTKGLTVWIKLLEHEPDHWLPVLTLSGKLPPPPCKPLHDT
jgi:hypothetical protein